ncbi:MAG: hypothetical protein M3452_11485, partial [Chloroflexota bacterium]|nr:hypothetical protein [Chloroflexota bacterium]
MGYKESAAEERREDERRARDLGAQRIGARSVARYDGPSPALKATLLSFLWPGLGQWYLGRRVAALLFALPALLIILAFVSLGRDGLESLAGRLFDPPVALTIMGGILVLALWRLLSMADAWWIGRQRERTHEQGLTSTGPVPSGPRRLAAVAALAIIVVVVHAVPAGFAFKFYEAGSEIFQPDGGVAAPPPTSPGGAPSEIPGPTIDPALSPDPGGSPPLPPPIPTIPPDVTDDGLVNVLFVGTDALPRRPADHRLADSITLAS